MATTHDAQDIQAAKQEIIVELDHLNLGQLRQVLALINALTGLRKGMSGTEFVAWVSGLRDKIGITDQEFDQFEAILQESRPAEKRRLEGPEHE